MLESKLGKVPSATAADSAGSAKIAQIKTVTAAGVAPFNGTQLGTATATCPAGMFVVGGGTQVADTVNEYVEDLWPSSTTAYTGRVFNSIGGSGPNLGFTVYAICAPAAAAG